MARPPFQNEHEYALVQEVQRHDDAVIWYGEMTACIMMWSVRDFEADRVGRCSVCYVPLGSVADAYEQPSKRRCTSCYGTSFEGGIRALIYRPAIWAEDGVSEGNVQRGFTSTFSGTVQLTSDFNMRDGDYLVRQDGTRWRIGIPTVSEITTGFGPTGTQIPSGAIVRVQMEDPSSVVQDIPVSQFDLEVVGWSPYMFYPSTGDIINGSLVVDDWAENRVDLGPTPGDDEETPIYDGGPP